MEKLFKLILIQEIRRLAEEKTIKQFYALISLKELSLQFLCVDAILSRGSLPLAEEYLISKNYDSNDIIEKLEKMKNYDFYFTTELIFNFLKKEIEKFNLEGIDILIELKELADEGILDYQSTINK